jgi:hypothetical protein
MFWITSGLGLLSVSTSELYSHLKKRIKCILYVLYVPIHLCNGSVASILRKLLRKDNRSYVPEGLVIEEC